MISIIAGWELWAGAGLVLAGFSLFVVGLICARALYGYGYRSGWQDARATQGRGSRNSPALKHAKKREQHTNLLTACQ